MNPQPVKMSLFDYDEATPGPSPAQRWEREATKRALDELFSLTTLYRGSAAYLEFLRFTAHFRSYAPYNAMLVHIQMPGATYVAPPHRWLDEYRCRIRPGARPLVILQPAGPVTFVFDVSDVEAEPDAPPLPRTVAAPFETTRGQLGVGIVECTIENAKRDGIRITNQSAGAQSAGSMSLAKTRGVLKFEIKGQPKLEVADVPLQYELLFNDKLSREAQYATIVHELAHLYCGHLGTPEPRWWPDRRGLSHAEVEFEAESVTWLICERLGIDNPSAEYLANFVRENEQVPDISLECVTKAAGLIEQMGRGRLGLRKTRAKAKD